MRDRGGRDVPIQPVERPMLCNPYVEPTDHWVYDRQTGQAAHGGMRRPGGGGKRGAGKRGRK